MADLNKVFLMGRLTFDPELRHTTSGLAVTELRMATSRGWTGRDGERKEETLFIDVTVWDRAAENCCQYLKKGSSIHVEGSLRMDTWDDKSTGEKRSKIRVQADRVQFLDRRDTPGMGGGGSDEYGSAPSPSPRRASGMNESRGSNGASRGMGGPGSGSVPGPGPSSMPRRPAPAPEPEPIADETDEDDIPF